MTIIIQGICVLPPRCSELGRNFLPNFLSVYLVSFSFSVSLFFHLVLLPLHSGGMIDELALVIVLGAQLVPSTDPPPPDGEGRPLLVSSFHGEMRVAAAAALLSHSRRRPMRFVMSGGYNVGVRYVVDDEQQRLLDPPCFKPWPAPGEATRRRQPR